jgi:hypothetical protein
MRTFATTAVGFGSRSEPFREPRGERRLLPREVAAVP